MHAIPGRGLRKTLVFAVVTTFLFAGLPDLRAQQSVTIEVKGPTVIAFFRHVTEEELDKDPDTNEALSDFQLYAAQAREPMQRAGIHFEVVSARSFRIRIKKQITDFRSKATDVGYYFIAPGRKPHVEYGVMTDIGLMEIAKKYFKPN